MPQPRTATPSNWENMIIIGILLLTMIIIIMIIVLLLVIIIMIIIVLFAIMIIMMIIVMLLMMVTMRMKIRPATGNKLKFKRMKKKIIKKKNLILKHE